MRKPVILAIAGGSADHASGDFVIAFSTGNRLSARGEQRTTGSGLVAETGLSGLFRATIETTEEAILNSLLRVETMVGRDGVERLAIPVGTLLEVLCRQNLPPPQESKRAGNEGASGL
ncbi:P1 family peptidase [bacterium]|nr:P1 family peptidase [bacterium]